MNQPTTTDNEVNPYDLNELDGLFTLLAERGRKLRQSTGEGKEAQSRNEDDRQETR